MTKEECIALLNRYAEYSGMGIPNLAGCKEAMRMAAKLLSQPSLPSVLDEAAEESARSWRKNPDGTESRELFFQPHIRGFKAGAEWMAGQVMMLKWKYPEEKYQYPECLTRIMDEYGDWHYTISEGHLNPDCEYISLAELSLRLATR